MSSAHNIATISYSSKKLLLIASYTAACIAGIISFSAAISYGLPVYTILAITSTSAVASAYFAQIVIKHAIKKGAIKPELRFNKVLSVSMTRKVVNKQYDSKDITLDNPAELVKEVVELKHTKSEAEIQFRPATIMYEALGTHTNTDTCPRDQAVVNAKLVLLSMDHTKQIPH